MNKKLKVSEVDERTPEEKAEHERMFEELYGNMDAELHPLLADHLYESEFVGTALKHPLVFQVPYHDMLADISNRMLQQKWDSICAAVNNRDWTTYMYLHERPFRADAVIELDDYFDVTDEEWWDVVKCLWVDTENPWQWQDKAERIFESGRAGRDEFLMDDDEREVLESLPDTIKVWRGYNMPSSKMGWSWTIDKTKAVWFAQRLTHRPGQRLYVAHGKVAKEEVVAFIDDRGESEIVVNPVHVRVYRTEKIEKRDAGV